MAADGDPIIGQQPDAYERFAMTQAGDPESGRQLFNTHASLKCTACHKVQGTGNEVGPDLSSIGGKFDRPHLIESLLEPSRQIVEGYRTSVVATVDGRIITGVIKQDSDAKVILADVEGKLIEIQKTDIEQLKDSPNSLMPTGINEQLSLQQFVDLIAYLESLRPGGKENMGAGVVGPITLPAGFKIRTLVTGIDAATAMEVLPDGRLLICEQTGAVRVVENGRLLEKPFVSLPVDAFWERGVIGVTCHPNFPRQPFVYVCWVAKAPYPHHRVSRFTADGNVAVPGSEKVLLVGDDQSKMGGKVPAGHQGGALHFGSDGKLLIGIGEQTAGVPSQDLDTFLGKMLRINDDGSIPEDNPFVGQATGKYRAIWARGCRNPFTFAVRREDGLLLINDVGGEFEEINVGKAGANYGWPVVEHGPRDEYAGGQYQGPIYWYPQSSINGGDFCPADSNWPVAWKGRYFFADFVQAWIKAIEPNEPAEAALFAANIRRPVDLRFSPDGSLVALVRNAWVIDDRFQSQAGSLLQIRYEPARENNQSIEAPEPKIEVGPPSASGKLPASASPLDEERAVRLTVNSQDDSAGGLAAYKIETPSATYYLEKQGAGLSSLVDIDGKDWLSFHPLRGSGAGGEYRGFPNAVHQQSGSYFHPKNEGTDPATTRVGQVRPSYVSIVAESLSGHWSCRYEFFSSHCEFTMTRVPPARNYWILYEGTPGGKFDLDDWWMTSSITTPQPMSQKHAADIPAPEWIAFGDSQTPRALLLLNHVDDDFPDYFYQMQEKMTVFGFGRQGINKFLSSPGLRFSVALLETNRYEELAQFAGARLKGSGVFSWDSANGSDRQVSPQSLNQLGDF